MPARRRRGLAAMSQDVQPLLLDYLGKRYANVKERLRKVLGNDDLADDALHDTWLRLKKREHEEEGDGPVRSPGAYLIRMAVNIAVDVQRRASRSVSGSEVDALLEEIADPAPDPLQVAQGRADLASFLKILDRLPERRRKLVVLVQLEGLTQREAAVRLGVSLRTVETDLKRAYDYLNAYMAARENNERF
jgi:RNA polymerase sigma factor (sigma-70 family)